MKIENKSKITIGNGRKPYLGDMMDDYGTHLRHGINYMRKDRETIDPKGHATELFTGWSQEEIVRADGFNVVRVFLNAAAQMPGTIAKKGERGLVPAYVAKVADFLDRAQRHGIAVMLCMESFPQVAPFTDGLCLTAPALSAANAEYMEAGRVEAKARFLKELIKGLRAASPPSLSCGEMNLAA